MLRAQQEPKLTQSRLAFQAGIGRARYAQIEVGDAVPSEADRAAIADVLGVSVNDIAWPVVQARRSA